MAYTKVDDFHNLYYDIFPDLWPLRSMGEETFKNFQKIANRIVRGYKISILVCILTSTSGLPWYGHNYEIFLYVKIFTDMFGKWRIPLITMFNLSLYHITFMVLESIAVSTYLVLHLYNQCSLLNKRLKNLKSYADTRQVPTVQSDEDYQNTVNYEMTCCIRHHQTLLK
ncbi:hypothetical protein Zmor_004960 [Zophobas morio]|uniref:Uncharacterized protein n=1 Tax=Zophobas morio TaxID=2755281 RepID=A0AA38MK04_9CUCU|nr:hypothetical protein Zmor_004960 [Zophobas morio]